MPSEPSTESALPRDPGRRCQGPVSPAVFFYNPFLSLFNPFSSASICEVTRSITPRSYNPMLYSGFEARRSARRSFHKLTSWSLEYQLSALRCIRYLGNPFTGRSESLLEAMLTMGERLSRDYQKPHYGIPEVTTSEGTVSVQERIVKDRPFASLLNFHRDTARRDPKVLVLAPMSGHYATLLRDTVQALLVDHDVYITDWHNARDIPTAPSASTTTSATSSIFWGNSARTLTSWPFASRPFPLLSPRLISNKPTVLTLRPLSP